MKKENRNPETQKDENHPIRFFLKLEKERPKRKERRRKKKETNYKYSFFFVNLISLMVQCN